MKKFILSSLLFLLLGSFGGFIVKTAQADTLTPAEAATLTQSLTSMKAELLNLEQQAAEQASAPVTVSASAPSTQEIATIQSELQALTLAFGELNQTIAQNPAALTASNRVALRAILGNMSVSLVAMNQELAGSPASAPVAMATPNVTVTPSQNNVSAQVGPTADNQPTVGVPAAPTPAPAPETAQVASSFSLSRGWMVTLGIIVLLLIAYVAWLSRKDKNVNQVSTQKVNAAPSSAPKAVAPSASIQKSVEVKIMSATQPETPRPPVAPSAPTQVQAPRNPQV